MKEQTIKLLKKIQQENPYIQSIYLWGSIPTDEYIESQSDIDAIAFVDESTDISKKTNLMKFLVEIFQTLK